LFLLGHAVWGYLICRLTGKKIHTEIPLSLALLVGILPDFDLYLQPIGLAHHTYTHSLLILGPLAVLISIIYRRRGLIVSVGILSHLLTDSVVGTIPIIFPISVVQIGLRLGIPSAIDTILEVGGLLVIVLYLWQNGDAVKILRGEAKNIWLIIPLASIISLSLLFALDNNIYLPEYAFARQALIGITLGHYLLGVLMFIAIFQGSRAWIKERITQESGATR